MIAEATPKGLTASLLAQIYRVQDLFKDKQYDEAEAVNAEIIASGFQDAAVYHTAGTLAYRQGRSKEAIAHYRKALEIDPTFRRSRDQLIVLVDCDPDTTAEEATAERRAWWQTHGWHRWQTSYGIPQPDLSRDRPLRVGYVSGDFCRHSAQNVFGPIIFGHSEAVIPFCYSSTAKSDSVTGRYEMRSGWREMTCISDAMMSQQIIADQIDILVDLSGYTPGNRLPVFAGKPAPITVTAWGYATGLGWPGEANPVLFADPIVLPWSQRGADQVVDLPCVISYQGPDVGPPNELPCLNGPVTFGVFQRSMKINDAFVAICRRILERLPESRLIFKGDYSDAFCRALSDKFGPVAERVEIQGVTSQLDHLAAYWQIDLCLDPFPQTGGVSTCEALSMGVPCVTLLGPRVIQRASASILSNVFGLENHFTASDPYIYVNKAVQWVTTGRDVLAVLRHELPMRLQQSSVIDGYVPAVEQAYRNLWTEYCEAA